MCVDMMIIFILKLTITATITITTTTTDSINGVPQRTEEYPDGSNDVLLWCLLAYIPCWCVVAMVLDYYKYYFKV